MANCSYCGVSLKDDLAIVKSSTVISSSTPNSGDLVHITGVVNYMCSFSYCLGSDIYGKICLYDRDSKEIYDYNDITVSWNIQTTGQTGFDLAFTMLDRDVNLRLSLEWVDAIGLTTGCEDFQDLTVHKKSPIPPVINTYSCPGKGLDCIPDANSTDTYTQCIAKGICVKPGGAACNDPMKWGCTSGIPNTYLAAGAIMFMMMMKR